MNNNESMKETWNTKLFLNLYDKYLLYENAEKLPEYFVSTPIISK